MVWVDGRLCVVQLMSRDTVMTQYRVISLFDTPQEGRCEREGRGGGRICSNGQQFHEQVGERVQTAAEQMFARVA